MELKEEDKFKDNAVDFFKFMQDVVGDFGEKGIDLGISQESLTMLTDIAEEMKGKDMIIGFVDFVYPHWKYIRERNKTYFIENVRGVMTGISARNIEIFVKMCQAKDSKGKPVLDKETEKTIWEYYESFVRLSIKYIHLYKNLRSNGEYKSKYYRTVCDNNGENKKQIEITDNELKDLINKWDIKINS